MEIEKGDVIMLRDSLIRTFGKKTVTKLDGQMRFYHGNCCKFVIRMMLGKKELHNKEKNLKISKN